jgi:NADH-quinone oxidoreductase subunit G
LDLGYDIPHFCYHPGLSLDGNCRMCCVNLIDVMTGKPVMAPDLSKQPFETYPKPVISCREPLNPRGMVVETETPAVLASRKLVMEFFLINHPLDCPVCDKAGECMLQDHSFAHGQADSRFLERKVEAAPKDLGPTIKLWTDRCIKCRRCTRFLDEISGTRELYLVQRGDRTEIDISPGHPVDNPLMGNIVDLCPVGALIDKDLIYSYRAWYLRDTPSVCADCAKGCNITVQSQKEFVRRLVPRENREVNGWWMCERGRKDFRYVADSSRILQARIAGEAKPVEEEAEEAGRRLAVAAAGEPESVAGLCSAWLTLEELHVFKRLFTEKLKGARFGLLAEPNGKEQVFPGFKIEADQNPNRAGARLILGSDAENSAAAILEDARAEKLTALYLVSSMPHYVPPPELLEALGNVAVVIVQDLKQGPLAEKAHILLPGSSFAEKDGVFVNAQNRAQVARRAVDPLGQGHDDLSVLQHVAHGAGLDLKVVSAREVFREMAEHYAPLAGLTHQKLGRKGLVLGA